MSWGFTSTKYAVPWWTIIQWLALLGRLSTKDRLQQWGVIADAQCVLWAAAMESHVHLLFHSPYSYQSWRSIQRRFSYSCSFLGFHKIMEWMIQYHSDSQFVNLVTKVVLAAIVYHIWGERNRCLFQHCSLDMQGLETKIWTEIRASISSWRRVKRTGVNLALCSRWCFSSSIFYSCWCIGVLACIAGWLFVSLVRYWCSVLGGACLVLVHWGMPIWFCIFFLWFIKSSITQ